MDFTVTIGAWIFPALLTIAAFLTALIKAPEGGTYGAGLVIGFGFLMMAAIVSLIAWLVWAVLS